MFPPNSSPPGATRSPPTRQLIVNTTSASGGAVKALQRHDRVVIAATKSGTEKNATVFARYWVEALQDPGADIDKNQIITGARGLPVRHPQDRGVLRDRKTPGDRTCRVRGGRQVGPGARCRGRRCGGACWRRSRWCASAATRRSATDPAKLALLKQKEQLEQRIDLLKYQRAAMPAEEYRAALSQALVALAKVQQELDK